jgi:hypothetical protein
MTRIENIRAEPPTLTPEQRAEDDDLAPFCHAAAVRLFQMLDREEAEVGCAVDDSSSARRRRSVQMISMKSPKSVVSELLDLG